MLSYVIFLVHCGSNRLTPCSPAPCGSLRLIRFQKLDAPIFTPTTKAEVGHLLQ